MSLTEHATAFSPEELFDVCKAVWLLFQQPLLSGTAHAELQLLFSKATPEMHSSTYCLTVKKCPIAVT